MGAYMKIRNGFVSNSSSSSFVIKRKRWDGTYIEEEAFMKTVETMLEAYNLKAPEGREHTLDDSMYIVIGAETISVDSVTDNSIPSVLQNFFEYVLGAERFHNG